MQHLIQRMSYHGSLETQPEDAVHPEWLIFALVCLLVEWTASWPLAWSTEPHRVNYNWRNIAPPCGSSRHHVHPTTPLLDTMRWNHETGHCKVEALPPLHPFTYRKSQTFPDTQRRQPRDIPVASRGVQHVKPMIDQTNNIQVRRDCITQPTNIDKEEVGPLIT